MALSLEIRRGAVTASPEGWFEFEYESGRVDRVPVPTYSMPDVAKLSAGYCAKPGMDLIDLFIGSEGTLGIVTSAILRVIALPRRLVALVPFDSDHQAVALTAALRRAARSSWRGEGHVDVSAIEFMDGRALALVPDEAFTRAGVERPGRDSGLLLVQIELAGDDDQVLQEMSAVLQACGIESDPQVALPDDDRGAARLFELREAVPSSLNAMIAAAKLRVHPDLQKTAGDFIVPFERLEESLAMYREVFTRFGLEHALWGHVSDGNMHPNLVPRSIEDVHRAKEALLEMARGVGTMHGAPLAEHGVGRSALKQQMLRELYGEKGIEEMRAVKRALDPDWKLAAGVLFPDGQLVRLKDSVSAREHCLSLKSAVAAQFAEVPRLLSQHPRRSQVDPLPRVPDTFRLHCRTGSWIQSRLRQECPSRSGHPPLTGMSRR